MSGDYENVIESIERDDCEIVSRIMGRGFMKDPLFVFFQPDEKKRLSFLEGMFEKIMNNQNKKHLKKLVLKDKTIGAAILYSQNGMNGFFSGISTGIGILWNYYLASDSFWAFLKTLWQLRLFSTAESEVMENEKSYFYIGYLAANPDCQGKGLGSKLFDQVLLEADKQQKVTYLETTNKQNHSFYLRKGFQIKKTFKIFGNIEVTIMTRNPS